MLLLLLAPLALSADDLQLHGYGKAQLQVMPWTGDVAPSARLQQDLSYRRQRVGFRAAFDLDWDMAALSGADVNDRSAGLSILPVECRVDVHADDFDLSLGKQYVFWGQTDWAIPTDLFTPWDYAHMSSELEDYRLAPWAARWTGWTRDTSLDLVWVPLPMPHAMDFSGAATEMISVGEAELPERTLENGDIGLRLASRAGGFDFAAMAFHGLDKRPSMRMDVDLSEMPPLLTLVPVYRTMWAFGGDASTGIGPVLIKAEGAYYRTQDTDGTDIEIRNPEVYAVAGLTWVPHANFNMTVQGTFNHLLLYDPDDELAARQAAGDMDPDVDPTDSVGVVERLQWTYKDQLSVSVTGLQYADTGEHFEMAMASYKVADGFTALGGVVLFGGPEETGFGALQDQSRVWIEGKASF